MTSTVMGAAAWSLAWRFVRLGAGSHLTMESRKNNVCNVVIGKREVQGMHYRILLVGATGLVGQGVLTVVLQADDVIQVTALVRRECPIASPKLQILRLSSFTALALEQLDLAGMDACLYCAGPLPILMVEAAYHEATVGLLRRVVTAYAKANPRGCLFYISGAGADPASRWMPLRVKGYAESSLHDAGIPVICLRPGLIRPNQGERSSHAMRRWAYALGAPVLTLASSALPGGFTTTSAVGNAMLTLLRRGEPYPRVVDNQQINALGGPRGVLRSC